MEKGCRSVGESEREKAELDSNDFSSEVGIRLDAGPAFWLRWLLALTGCGLMLATITVFFPVGLSATIHGWLGLGEFPDRPITIYLARSTSMLYAVHGSLILIVSFDMKRYWPLIRVFGWLHIVMGLTMLGIDVSTPMPLYWIVGEGIPIAMAGVLILWLWQKSNSESKSVS